MGPVAAGHSHSVTGQAADLVTSSQAADAVTSNSASRYNKQRGSVFDGWVEPTDDWQTAGIHQAASHVPVPDVFVSTNSDMMLHCVSPTVSLLCASTYINRYSI